MDRIWLRVPESVRKLLSPSLAIRYVRESIGRGKVIYEITCLASGEQYVGQTRNFHKRMRKHDNDLAAGRHHSKVMQCAFNSFGPDAFRVEIIENCDHLTKELRKAKERFYVWALRPAFNS